MMYLYIHLSKIPTNLTLLSWILILDGSVSAKVRVDMLNGAHGDSSQAHCNLFSVEKVV